MKPEGTVKITADKKSLDELSKLAQDLQLAFLKISIQFEEMKKAVDKYLESKDVAG